MIGNKRRAKKAFTLIEVMISVSLFAVIILSVTNIFKLSIDGQRSAIATQNVQESLKYFLEVTAKEMRMAQRDQGVCGDVPDNQIFSVDTNLYGSVLYFKNYYGECISYSLEADGENQRFQISRQSGVSTQIGFVSPSKIKIDSLHFIISSSSQPMVTINLEASALDSAQFTADMILQTSITSRYYKQP
jgi:prepilin-type N-terminal cleavage/methylation domain-containing protein